MKPETSNCLHVLSSALWVTESVCVHACVCESLTASACNSAIRNYVESPGEISQTLTNHSGPKSNLIILSRTPHSQFSHTLSKESSQI